MDNLKVAKKERGKTSVGITMGDTVVMDQPVNLNIDVVFVINSVMVHINVARQTDMTDRNVMNIPEQGNMSNIPDIIEMRTIVTVELVVVSRRQRNNPM